MIMVHSDDKGLVLPPKVAQEQVVVVPIIKKSDNEAQILDYAYDIMKKLKAVGVRTTIDDREGKNPGNKFNHWEMRGIPLRLEIGGQEVTKSEIRYAKRNDGVKGNFPLKDLVTGIQDLLANIHIEMYQKALDARLQHQKEVYDWKTFMAEIMQRNICLTPWCGIRACECAVNDKSKEESEVALQDDENETLLTGAAKTLCIPDEQKPLPKDCKCFHCGKEATKWAVWGRTF
jgi:prolyl-tRNA synthetase